MGIWILSVIARVRNTGSHFQSNLYIVNSRLADTLLLRTIAITDKIQIPIYSGLTESDSRYYGLWLFRTTSRRCLLQRELTLDGELNFVLKEKKASLLTGVVFMIIYTTNSRRFRKFSFGKNDMFHLKFRRRIHHFGWTAKFFMPGKSQKMWNRKVLKFCSSKIICDLVNGW